MVRTFSYDYANRLVAVQNSLGPVAQYAYDALGRRIAKMLYEGLPPVPVATNRYLYAGGQVIEENAGGGAVAKVHIYLPDDIRPGETISGCVVTFAGTGRLCITLRTTKAACWRSRTRQATSSSGSTTAITGCPDS